MATDREIEAIIQAAEAIAEETEEDRDAEGDTYLVSSVNVDNLITALSGFGKFESPSPETPGLREAAQEFYDLVCIHGHNTNPITVQRRDDAADALFSALSAPPNREGVVLEGQVEFVRGYSAMNDDWEIGGEALGEILRRHPKARMEITPLGESGGEQ